jgi:hypothetical protein
LASFNRRRPRRLNVPAPAHAITIRRAAEILGEGEELLWDIAADMEPEHGCLWIHDINDQQTVAFTSDGMEYLREMLPEYKRARSPRGLERTVTNKQQTDSNQRCLHALFFSGCD